MNERLCQEHQKSVQTIAEVNQRLEEQDRNHQKARQSEITRLQAEHKQQMAKATRAHQQMETRIQELERVQSQVSMPFLLCILIMTVFV